MPRQILLPVLLAGCFAVAAGCGKVESVPDPPRRIDDPLTAADLNLLLAVVEALPEGKLPAIPPILLPAPQWSGKRTLPVYELLAEERRVLAERALVDWLAAHCPTSRPLRRALRRERLTLE